jgi:hypothetical protein
MQTRANKSQASEQERPDWGHTLRAKPFNLLQSAFVGFTYSKKKQARNAQERTQAKNFKKQQQ